MTSVFMRTPSDRIPDSLDFGEPAFVEGRKALYVGLSDNTPYLINAPPPNGTDLQIASFSIQLPSGQNGGIFVAGQWVKRSLTHQRGEFGSLLEGQIVLPVGRYYFSGWSTSLEVGSVRNRLISKDANIEVYGASLFSNHYALPSLISGDFELSEPSLFSLEHRCSRSASNTWNPRNWTFGYRTGFDAADELYASLTFWKR